MAERAGLERDTRELLGSVAGVARAIFGAPASAIFLLDEENDTLIFEAVAGVGEDYLVGAHFPTGLGIIGWVLSSGEPVILDEVATNRECAEQIADITGYRPGALMAAPLLSGVDVLGLLVVLDPVPQSRSNLTDLELLALFANQAAVALRVVRACAAGAGRGDAQAELLDELREFLRTRS